MDLFEKKYTDEQIKELRQWIEETKPTGSIDLGEGIKIDDIEFFLKQIKNILENRYNNSAYSGQICIAMNLKAKYESK